MNYRATYRQSANCGSITVTDDSGSGGDDGTNGGGGGGVPDNRRKMMLAGAGVLAAGYAYYQSQN